MIKVGITGQAGFIGSNLYRTLGLYPSEYKCIPFSKEFFSNDNELKSFVSECDVIVHLAGVNRHENEEILYTENVDLANKLVKALRSANSSAAILFSSSVQEDLLNNYGKAKKAARGTFLDWSKENNSSFYGCLVPNVFGPFGRPFYNSVVSTFCYLLTHEGNPEIKTDGELKLIFVQELVDEFIALINKAVTGKSDFEYRIPHTSVFKVSELLKLLEGFRDAYLLKGNIPQMDNVFQRNLFNTFRSYIDHNQHFPVHFINHKDARGSFTELIRTGIGGQSSFSITKPGITRGNHYHTRKIERFAVIKGEAIIRIRKIGTDEVIEFKLDGESPSYVDMPIWFTHNITNIGNDELYTMFWINEPYNPDDPDTWITEV